MARCLLFEKGLLKKLWAKAINNVVYLQNRLPTKAINGKTPYEAQIGAKPSMAHLRVFGSICYAYVPKVKRDKLDQRVDIGVLASYSIVSKGYRILNLIIKKVNVGRSVKFDENGTQNQETTIGESSNKNINAENIPQTYKEEDFNDGNYGIKGTKTL